MAQQEGEKSKEDFDFLNREPNSSFRGGREKGMRLLRKIGSWGFMKKGEDGGRASVLPQDKNTQYLVSVPEGASIVSKMGAHDSGGKKRGKNLLKKGNSSAMDKRAGFMEGS